MKSIHRIEGYYERFYWHLQNGCVTHLEAYLAVEQELEDLDGESRYSSYESFRSAKSQRRSYKLKRRRL